MTALLEYLDLTALLEYIDLLNRYSGGPFRLGPRGKMPQLPPPPLWAALFSTHTSSEKNNNCFLCREYLECPVKWLQPECTHLCFLHQLLWNCCDQMTFDLELHKQIAASPWLKLRLSLVSPVDRLTQSVDQFLSDGLRQL